MTIKVLAKTVDGVEHALFAQAGMTLMEAIRDGGVHELLALCGGCCSCATCHVVVDASFVDALPPMTDDERVLLEGSGLNAPGSRLSCQVALSKDLQGILVEVPNGF